MNLTCKNILAARSCPPDKVHGVMSSPDEDIFAFRSQYHGSMERAAPHQVTIGRLGVISKQILWCSDGTRGPDLMGFPGRAAKAANGFEMTSSQ